VFAYALKQIQKWYKREKLENSFTYGGLWAYMERWNKKSYDLLSRVRSLEASLLIAKHVNVLFGRLHKKGSIEEYSEHIRVVSLRELNLFILEGIAFGMFLLDGDDYVNSKCPFLRDK
jgi:hypothetical protein